MKTVTCLCYCTVFEMSAVVMLWILNTNISPTTYKSRSEDTGYSHNLDTFFQQIMVPVPLPWYVKEKYWLTIYSEIYRLQSSYYYIGILISHYQINRKTNWYKKLQNFIWENCTMHIIGYQTYMVILFEYISVIATVNDI